MPKGIENEPVFATKGEILKIEYLIKFSKDVTTGRIVSALRASTIAPTLRLRLRLSLSVSTKPLTKGNYSNWNLLVKKEPWRNPFFVPQTTHVYMNWSCSSDLTCLRYCFIATGSFSLQSAHHIIEFIRPSSTKNWWVEMKSFVRNARSS